MANLDPSAPKKGDQKSDRITEIATFGDHFMKCPPPPVVAAPLWLRPQGPFLWSLMFNARTVPGNIVLGR